VRRAAARPGRLQLPARLVGPGDRAEALEPRQRLAQAVARLGPPPRPVQPPPVAEQCPGTLERHRAVVELERLGERRVEVLVEHAAAARQRRAGPGGARGGRRRS